MNTLKVVGQCLGPRTGRSLVAALLAFLIVTPVAVRGLVRSTACLESVVLRANGVDAAAFQLLSPLGSPIETLEMRPGEFAPWTPTAVGSLRIAGTGGAAATVEVWIGNPAEDAAGGVVSAGREEQVLSDLRRGSRISRYFAGAINYRGDLWVCCWAVTNGVLIGLLTFCVVHQLPRLVSILREVLSVVLAPVTLSIAVPMFVMLGLLGMRNSDPLTLSYRYVDEWIILEGILDWRQFWSALYGSLYNSMLMFASVPGLIADDLQVVVIGQRLVTAAAAAWSVGLVCLMASGFLRRPVFLLAAMPVIGMPGFWTEASIIRPDWPMTFFCLLTFTLLLRDEGRYGISFLAAVAAFSAAMAIKLHALMLSPALIIYVGLSCREPGLMSRMGRMALVFACVYPLLDFEVLLLSNSMDLVSFILRVIMAQSGIGQLAVKLPDATVAQKMQAIDALFITPQLFFAVQILGVVAAVLLCTKRTQRGILAASGTAVAISVHHVFLLTLALPTYTVIWTTLVTAASLISGLAVLQRLQPVQARTAVAGVLLVFWGLAAAIPRLAQFSSVATDHYMSVSDGAELQQKTWQQINRVIGLRTVDRVNILCSALVCLDADMVRRKSFDLSRIWYDNMRVVQVNTDYLQRFDIIVLKIRGQERVPEATLARLQAALPACGFRPAFQNSMVSVFASTSSFSSEAFD